MKLKESMCIRYQKKKNNKKKLYIYTHFYLLLYFWTISSSFLQDKDIGIYFWEK